MVQPEYDVSAAEKSVPEWREVARFDYDATSDGGHDVTEEGLHLDVYRDGERYARSHSFPRLPPGAAIRFGEHYRREHADRFLGRFKQ